MRDDMIPIKAVPPIHGIGILRLLDPKLIFDSFNSNQTILDLLINDIKNNHATKNHATETPIEYNNLSVSVISPTNSIEEIVW